MSNDKKIEFLFTYPTIVNRLAVRYEMHKRGWEYAVWELLRYAFEGQEFKEYGGAITTRETRPEVLEWSEYPERLNHWFPVEIFNVKEELESFVNDAPDIDDILKGYIEPPPQVLGQPLEFSFISNNGNEILIVDKNRLEKKPNQFLGQFPSHYIKTGPDDPLFEYYLYVIRKYKRYLKRVSEI